MPRPARAETPTAPRGDLFVTGKKLLATGKKPAAMSQQPFFGPREKRLL
jgi:hypothetical protein